MPGKYNTNLTAGQDFFVKKHHWIPGKLNVEYFAFGTRLYCRGDGTPLPRHELLHISQFKKYGIVGVMAHYFFHFTRNYLKCGDGGRSFLDIPFEKEARAFERSESPDVG
jgi:hypothetical protein